jgi:hypothetical protein
MLIKIQNNKILLVGVFGFEGEKLPGGLAYLLIPVLALPQE